MLPDMDGLEVCERARAQWSRFYPPIIMLTALSGLEQRRRGLAAGADDYISKPYDATMLLDRVQTWVRVRDHLKAAHEALEDATRREVGAQLESLGRAGRELAHLLNNELALPTGVLNLLEEHPDAPADLRPLIEKAAADLAAAGRHVDALSPGRGGGAARRAERGRPTHCRASTTVVPRPGDARRLSDAAPGRRPPRSAPTEATSPRSAAAYPCRTLIRVCYRQRGSPGTPAHLACDGLAVANP